MVHRGLLTSTFEDPRNSEMRRAGAGRACCGTIRPAGFGAGRGRGWESGSVAEEDSMVWHSRRQIVLGTALIALVSACEGSRPSPSQEAASLDAPEIKAALAGIHGQQIEQHMRVLADDKLEGRGLGTEGYEGALGYVETTIKSYGLAPGRRSRRLPAARAAQEQRRRRRCERDGGPLVGGEEDPRLRQGLPARRGSAARAGRHRRCAGRVRRLRRQRARPRVRRLRGWRGGQGQGGGVPERRAARCSRATSVPTTRRVR